MLLLLLLNIIRKLVRSWNRKNTGRHLFFFFSFNAFSNMVEFHLFQLSKSKNRSKVVQLFQICINSVRSSISYKGTSMKPACNELKCSTAMAYFVEVLFQFWGIPYSFTELFSISGYNVFGLYIVQIAVLELIGCVLQVN